MARTFAINVPIDVAIRGGNKLDELLSKYASGQEDVIDDIARLTGQEIKTKLTVVTNVDTGETEKTVRRSTDLAEQYTKARQKSSKVEEGSLTNLRQSVNTLKQQRDATAKYIIDTENVRKNIFGQEIAVRKVSSAWTDANNKVQAAESALREVGGIQFAGLRLPDFSSFLSLANKATQIGAAIGLAVQAFQALNQAADVFIQRQQQIEAITLTLESFGVSSQGASETLAQAKVVALTYGASLAEVEKGYKRLTPVILSSGGSLETTDEVMKSLTARTTALGLNTEQSGRYIEAFAQVLGKGKLQSEELNQQFSELDGALRGQLQAFVASEYGITNLEEAMKNGQITSKIFTEFMIEAGKAARDELALPLNRLQQDIDNINPRQFQELSKTLATISIEEIGKTLAPFGKEIASIILAFQQFFASLTTNFPGIKRLASEFFTVVGKIAKVVVNVILLGFQTIFVAIDTALQRLYEFRDQLAQLPGVKQILQAVSGQWAFMEKNIAIAVDTLGSVNAATLKNRTATSEYTKNVAELYDKYKANKITVDELRDGISKLREAEATKVRIDEANQLKDVLTEQKSVFEGQVTALEAQITKTQAAFDARKLALEQEVALIEAPYRARMEALDAEEAKINVLKAAIIEKYAFEKGQVTQLQAAAKAASLAVEKDELAKLQLKRQNAALTGEEARALDAQIKQKQASIASSDLELKIAQEMSGIEAKSAQISNAKAKAEAERAVAVSDTQSKLEKLKIEEEQTIGRLEQQKAEYENIITEIDDNISRTEKLKTATKGVADEIMNIGDNIKKLESLKVNITKTEARALGGPVKAGRTYQVNELGKEAFLSSTGRLSMINKPAYGTWRAPSSGTVIPASITERLIQAQAIYSVSPASQASKLVQRTNFQPSSAQYSQLASSQSAMAIELGKLTQAVDKINRKEWTVDLNIAPGNPLLNRLKRT